ncbi:MAG: calcium-binding protein [Microcystis sp. LE19-131.1A]|uniref:calcium-binding protein n=1 Tax=Microcystis sp. LE19-131.1A TaxID=3016439 RepID=UPI0022C6B431|nr:calcium-binding protein [Microcystis sp. LE19-131.1A]MCZ8242218.1 calcium-binding protein [Microcystis sp. LE19-131.1A]
MVTISTSFSSLLTGGVSFDPAVTQSVRDFLTTPAFNNILIHVSGPGIPGITSNNLTSQGLLPGGDTAWRITTAGSPLANLTLARLGGGFSQPFPALPVNSFTFVKGGAAGNYVLSGDNFRKQLASGSQQNRIWLLLDTDSYNIVGSAFNDTLSGFDAEDTIFGGSLNDILTGNAGADTLHGDNGDDTLLGGSGNDSLDGDVGNDSLDGGSLNDTLIGGSGNDTLIGDTEDDSLDGGSEDDSLNGGSGNDSLDGGSGSDSLDGGSLNDTLIGGDGNDTLLGGSENDSLLGGTGNDSLHGGSENDTLIGGDGNDTLTGSSGVDRFVYNNSSEGVDSITDFGVGGADVIVLSSSGFGGLTTIGGTLDPSLFSATEDGTAKIIYSSGVLSFDQNLGLPGTLVTIANIAGPNAGTLGAGNIQVIA